MVDRGTGRWDARENQRHKTFEKEYLVVHLSVVSLGMISTCTRTDAMPAVRVCKCLHGHDFLAVVLYENLQRACLLTLGVLGVPLLIPSVTPTCLCSPPVSSCAIYVDRRLSPETAAQIARFPDLNQLPFTPGNMCVLHKCFVRVAALLVCCLTYVY